MPIPESASPARRPSLAERQPSGHLVTRASPSNRPKLHRAHTVGHGRLGTKNLSYGKNLNKLTKLAGDDAAPTRSMKTKAQTPSTSPAAASHGHVKRNSSTVSLPRVGSKVSIKKSHSNVSLKRNGSSTLLNKSGKLSNSLRRSQSQHSELDHIDNKPTGGFIMDEGEDDEAQDDEWTEESASQSPSTTRRSSTSRGARSGKATPAEEYSKGNEKANPQASPPESPESSSSQETGARQESDYDIVNPQPAHRQSRPLDAAAIASRLLGRNPSQLPAKVNYVSATSTPGSQTPPPPGSIDSNLAGSSMPEDGISRFLNAPASSGGSNYHLFDTSNHASMTPPSPNLHSRSQERSPSPSGGEDAVRRVKSTGNFHPRTPIITMDQPVAGLPPSITFSQPDRKRDESYTAIKMGIWKANIDKPNQTSPAPGPMKSSPIGMLSAEERDVRQYEDALIEMSFLKRFRRPDVEAIKRVYTPTKEEIEEGRQRAMAIALAMEEMARDEAIGIQEGEEGSARATWGRQGADALAKTPSSGANAALNDGKAVSSKGKDRAPMSSSNQGESVRAGSPGKVKGEHGDADGLDRPPSRPGRSRTVHFEGGGLDTSIMVGGDQSHQGEQASEQEPQKRKKKKRNLPSVLDKQGRIMLRSLWTTGEMQEDEEPPQENKNNKKMVRMVDPRRA